MVRMALQKRSPFDAFGFGSLFEDVFGKGLSTMTGKPMTRWAPAVDIRESETDYTFQMDLPGLSKDDVSISFEDDVLSIEGERKHVEQESNGKFQRVERAYGKFARSFTLPGHVAQDKVKASFDGGVLTIVVPKSEEAQPRKIAID